MRAVTGAIFSFIWMIAVFLIGFIIIAQLTLNATANASGALIGQAATNWTNFINYIWIAITLIALTPLIMVVLIFSGLFGQIQGGGQ
jgi:uncharacterized protein YqhQ